MTKRFIKIAGIDKLLELSKVVSVDIEKKMINIEELPNGTWRLIYTKSLIDDFSKVEGFEIIRED